MGLRVLAPHQGAGGRGEAGSLRDLEGEERRLVEPAFLVAARMQGHGNEHLASPEDHAHRLRRQELLGQPRGHAPPRAVLELVDRGLQAPFVGPEARPRHEGLKPAAAAPAGHEPRGQRQAAPTQGALVPRAGPPSSSHTRAPGWGGRGRPRTRDRTRERRPPAGDRRAAPSRPRGKGSCPEPGELTGVPAPASPGRKGSGSPRAPPPAASGSSRPRRRRNDRSACPRSGRGPDPRAGPCPAPSSRG